MADERVEPCPACGAPLPHDSASACQLARTTAAQATRFVKWGPEMLRRMRDYAMLAEDTKHFATASELKRLVAIVAGEPL